MHPKTVNLDKSKEKTAKSKVAALATGEDMPQICKKKLTINNYSNIESVSARGDLVTSIEDYPFGFD